MNPKCTNTQHRGHSRPRLQIVQPELKCPICSQKNITTTWTNHCFTYGSGESSVDLEVRLPVRQCDTCEFEYLDDAAEELKQIAVCNHLGVLPPGKIREIRERQELTRAVFSEVTGIGEASLNRWENGISIQSHANDRYLRLLAINENMLKLEKLAASRRPENTEISDTTMENRFRAVIVTSEMLEQQKAFRLRREAA